METKIYKTAKEFFKFLNNYEADIWIRGNKAFDVNGELVAEYNTQFQTMEIMTTVNSLSGGQTSSYIAANYPADYNVFALVRTSDINCLYPDAKVRQMVSDKIGTEFIGTLEDDMIINTILDLEQFIGQKIDWVTGKTFDEIMNRNGKRYLPNVTQRFCTTEMKLVPLYNWWKNNSSEPIEMRIGYRANVS